MHQIVKADKGDAPDRRARGDPKARHGDGAVEAAPRDAATAGRVMRVTRMTRAMSVKAGISMFRQMMFASGSGVHRTLRAGRRVCRRARACLGSVDEKRAADRLLDLSGSRASEILAEVPLRPASPTGSGGTKRWRRPCVPAAVINEG
ncbi:hypothetical protein [Burkholderia catarinensis]|uniref:hypothetical protein n=1 Tax=Burkholderia catarinensis TaxID=1108140 RepID=UPI001914BDC7|nr:hypothetical protein [Burkholderia catarinensis]